LFKFKFYTFLNIPPPPPPQGEVGGKYQPMLGKKHEKEGEKRR
jgi:hypothetical protein